MAKLANYLQRIGYHGDLAADLRTLRAVHRCHLDAITYENVDVQLGRPLALGIDDAYEKIVSRRRGGWCYEMNGLLGWALQEIGFSVRRVAGAVERDKDGDAALGNHLILLVELEEGVFVADVGFGDGFYEPIPLIAQEFHQRGFQFELSLTADGYWRLSNHSRGGARSFDFTLTPAQEDLFAAQCHDLQTSQLSPFVMFLVAERFVPQGYEIQVGRVAKTVSAHAVEKRVLSSADELVDRLGAVFDLDVPETASLWPRICAQHDQWRQKQKHKKRQ